MRSSLPAVPDSALPQAQRLGKQHPGFCPPSIFSDWLLLPETSIPIVFYFFFFLCYDNGSESFVHAMSKRSTSITGRAKARLYEAQETSSKDKKSLKRVRCINSAVNIHTYTSAELLQSILMCQACVCPTSHFIFVQNV